MPGPRSSAWRGLGVLVRDTEASKGETLVRYGRDCARVRVPDPDTALSCRCCCRQKGQVWCRGAEGSREGDRETGQAGHFISFAIRENGTLVLGSWELGGGARMAAEWEQFHAAEIQEGPRGGNDAGNRSLVFAPGFWNHAWRWW